MKYASSLVGLALLTFSGCDNAELTAAQRRLDSAETTIAELRATVAAMSNAVATASNDVERYKGEFFSIKQEEMRYVAEIDRLKTELAAKTASAPALLPVPVPSPHSMPVQTAQPQPPTDPRIADFIHPPVIGATDLFPVTVYNPRYDSDVRFLGAHVMDKKYGLLAFCELRNQTKTPKTVTIMAGPDHSGYPCEFQHVYELPAGGTANARLHAAKGYPMTVTVNGETKRFDLK